MRAVRDLAPLPHTTGEGVVHVTIPRLETYQAAVIELR